MLPGLAAAAAEALQENAKIAAKLMNDALQKLLDSGVLEEISDGLKEGLASMEENAAPLAAEALEELKNTTGALINFIFY